MDNIQPVKEQNPITVNRGGHQHDFTSFFNCHRLQLYNTAFKIVKSKTIAEDIAHDVLLRWWIKRDELIFVKNPASYLITMARNLTFDTLRRDRYETIAKKNMLDSFYYNGGTEDRCTEKQLQLLINKAVSSMPPKQQEVFRLVKEKGLCHKMTAHQLHISCATVKKHMAIALKFIRCYLQKNGVTVL